MCKACASHGCWGDGRYTRSMWWRAGQVPVKLAAVRQGADCDILQFDGLRVAGFADPGKNRLEAWIGKPVRLFVGSDGLISILPATAVNAPPNTCSVCGPHPCSQAGSQPGWCRSCTSCGCWNGGRFRRGPWGRAAWNGARLVKARATPEHDELVLDGLELECIARPVTDATLRSLVGRYIAFWPEFDAVVHVAPLPAQFAKSIRATVEDQHEKPT